MIAERHHAISDLVAGKMLVLHHLPSRIDDAFDTSVVVVNFGQNGLVFLDQVLDSNKITTCKINKVRTNTKKDTKKQQKI